MIEDIKREMLVQNNRSTAFPIFIVVENKKIFGVDSNFASDGRERKEDIETGDLCLRCQGLYHDFNEVPDECDDGECEDTFIYYRIERDVPNLYAAFFLTGKSCDAHIAANRHHYNETAHSYAISAYHNPELREALRHIAGEDITDEPEFRIKHYNEKA